MPASWPGDVGETAPGASTTVHGERDSFNFLHPWKDGDLGKRQLDFVRENNDLARVEFNLNGEESNLSLGG